MPTLTAPPPSACGRSTRRRRFEAYRYTYRIRHGGSGCHLWYQTVVWSQSSCQTTFCTHRGSSICPAEIYAPSLTSSLTSVTQDKAVRLAILCLSPPSATGKFYYVAEVSCLYHPFKHWRTNPTSLGMTNHPTNDTLGMRNAL